MELPSEKHDRRGSKSQSPMSLHIAKSGEKSNCITFFVDNATRCTEKQLRLAKAKSSDLIWFKQTSDGHKI